MDVLETRVDASGDEYRRNFEAMQALVEELRRELERARSERSERARKRNAG